jgi:hypothetical protein
VKKQILPCAQDDKFFLGVFHLCNPASGLCNPASDLCNPQCYTLLFVGGRVCGVLSLLFFS